MDMASKRAPMIEMSNSLNNLLLYDPNVWKNRWNDKTMSSKEVKEWMCEFVGLILLELLGKNLRIN